MNQTIKDMEARAVLIRRRAKLHKERRNAAAVERELQAVTTRMIRREMRNENNAPKQVSP